MDLSAIKGIGVKTEELLNKLGIMNVDDLLTYYPVRYDLFKRSDLETITEDEKVIPQ